MEVDAGQVNGLVNGTIDEQAADEHSLSPEISDVYDIFGDPDIFPRVGEEYQVEIPPLISEFDYCSFQRSTHEAESIASTLHKFQVGLPIPLIWIKGKAENNKRGPLKCKSTGVIDKIESPKLECLGVTQNGLDYEKSNPKLETIDSRLYSGVKLRELENSDVVLQETKIGMHGEHRGKGHYLVPGSASDAWSEIEEASFILGLYIFGKNLAQVKRFIGNKKMGDILSFYYGKFYKSDKYQRWSGCKKNKSRKYISGQKIFTGPRHQELMSRLLPNASEECRNKLLEVSKSFIEGKMLLEDYVLALKASVGLKALVEGVRIGRGKEDLTGLSIDSAKSTQAIPVRQEIPVGKACSMLTPSEIISFLTGGSRLSKAKTSDLFWEAVWPRLLARGWHSEQPGNYNYAVVSKNPLVFLVPGVKKFSRKLVKGNHYFDSVTDVLGKVASNPELIDLETHTDNDCTGKEGNGWIEDTKLDRENSPDQPRHCYLKVKTPNRSTDVMKFTVVDTSLASDKVRKVRELRSLPFGVSKASILEDDSDDENTSEEHISEPEAANSTCFDSGKKDITNASKFKIGKGSSPDLNGLESNPSKEELPRRNMTCASLSDTLIDQKKTDLLGNTKMRDGLKCEPLRTMVSNSKNDLVPVTKRRRRLTACSRPKKHSNAANFFVAPRVTQEVSSCPDSDSSKYSENVIADFLAPKVKQDKATYCPYNTKFSNKVHSRVFPAGENNSLPGFKTQKTKALADPVSNPSSIICKETVPDTSSSGTKDQNQKPKPQRTMIDLNLPVSPEDDADEPFANEVTEIQKSDIRKESGDLSVGINSKPMDHSDQQPDIHVPRQSTRNRPPTTRALEAFAFGYLDKKEKRRSRDSSASRPSRRVHRKVEGSSSGGVGFAIEERTSAVCNGNGNGNGNGSSSSNSDVLCTGFKC